jgi:L-rhamnose isomerase
VGGFEKAGAQLEGGGIQATVTTPLRPQQDELRADFLKALSMVPESTA